uniref:Uncharacterized protein n=1 Tax=Anguilla anguilla TaxID=7936 RepID=A0A0E9VYB0_ANGAN
MWKYVISHHTISEYHQLYRYLVY